MGIDLWILYALAIVGPIMIFLTHYVVKGRTRDMTRLWFITFFSYMVFYWLAKSNYILDPQDMIYGYALLWPIAAIAAFWLSEKLTSKEGSPIPFFKWMVYFLVAVVFAFLLDGLGGVMHWYTYNPAALDKTALINPISGMQVPSLLPFLLGIIMLGVFFLVLNVHKVLKARKIDETSATLLLAALSVVMSGFIWAATDFIISAIRSLM